MELSKSDLLDAMIAQVSDVKDIAVRHMSDRERMRAALQRIKEESIDPHASRIAERALDEK